MRRLLGRDEYVFKYMHLLPILFLFLVCLQNDRLCIRHFGSVCCFTFLCLVDSSVSVDQILMLPGSIFNSHMKWILYLGGECSTKSTENKKKRKGEEKRMGGDIFTSLWGDSTCHRFLTAWGLLFFNFVCIIYIFSFYRVDEVSQLI